MEAFYAGLVRLINAFFVEAARHGFAIIVLSLVACGLLLRSVKIEARYEQKIAEVDLRIEKTNKQWLAALNEARADLIECDIRRQELAIKVAELTVQFRNLKKGKK